MKNYFSALVLFVSLIIGQAFTTTAPLVCNTPQNVSTTSIDQGDISFDWDDCSGGCTEYKLKYYREEDSFGSEEYTASNSSFSFINLPTGSYKFYFATDCSGQISSFIIIEENIVN